MPETGSGGWIQDCSTNYSGKKNSNNFCRKFMGPDRIKNNFSVSTTSLVVY
jgi:hypothetical protein